MDFKMRQREKQHCVFILVIIFLLSGSGYMAGETNGNGSLPEKSIIRNIRSTIQARPNSNLISSAMPCLGEAHILIVNVLEEGQEPLHAAEEYQEILFGNHMSEGLSVSDENLTDYFEHVSYGKLHVTGEVVDYQCRRYSEMLFSPEEALMRTLVNRKVSHLDANGDSYLDGVIFLVPSIQGTTGYVKQCSIRLRDGYKVPRCAMISRTNFHVATACHEIIHLMGFPDLYAGHGVNPEGTGTDSIMEGKLFASSEETGLISANVPGILKLFFGWIDDVVEVSSSGTFQLKSYSREPEIMVIYPHGDTQSQFFFVVELISPDGNDRTLFMPSDVSSGINASPSASSEPALEEEGGYLRIWRVLLNEEDVNKYEFDYHEIRAGAFYRPFTYLEAISDPDGKSGFYLSDGRMINDRTNPGLQYFTEVKTGKYHSETSDSAYDNACWPTEFHDSGISVSFAYNNGVGECEITVDRECS